MKDWAFQDRNLNGCPVFVSISSFVPKMMIETSKNGSLKIAGGIEGELVLAIADKLNFTLALRSPSASERLKYSRKASILNDVLSGTAEIGIGRLRPTNDMEGKVVRSVMYDTECITWGVPRIVRWSNNVVWVEFTPKVWAIVGMIFAIGCATGYASHRIDSSAGVKRGTGIAATVFDVVSIHLGNTVAKVPISLGGRFMLMAYLYYATVLTTAYKTSLASILTTEKGTPMVVDMHDILKLNLSIGGSRYDFDILRDQENGSEVISRLVERFVVNNNDSATLRRLKMENNFAFLARGSSLDDERGKSVRSNGSVTFDVFNTCVLSYHTVMVIRKESFLREPINRVIRRLSEAGILKHWDIDKFDVDQIIKRRSAEKFFEERAGEKFQNIFLLYSIFIGFCALIFLIEISIPIIIDPRKK
ncbi:uncharacterized protein LOC125500696 [Athalia rosae]|uniref:uncharacterized protein LOC125500696 n=1 Tax=Athalia rosae TaxID=37344 RepID=UPI00203483E1|nr:uncharacterized protein LOC125500696 [Athalia rosae]